VEDYAFLNGSAPLYLYASRSKLHSDSRGAALRWLLVDYTPERNSRSASIHQDTKQLGFYLFLDLALIHLSGMH
jgi:hypothetical protein